jgi:PPE-repeat protein
VDFGTLPPEINSGRMHGGPGAGSMRQAAAAWDRLAIRLYTAAADYRAVTCELSSRWKGPAATAATRAATSYIDWLNATATRAEHVANQAAASASAHESAFAATVPPPAIDANRAQRRALAKANHLGQISPAIAHIDAEYDQMWAQDADAMYAYACASADASTVTPFTSPPPTVGPAGHDTAIDHASRTLIAAPQIISAGYQVMSAIPEALRALTSSSLESPLESFGRCLSPVTPCLSKLSSLSAPSDFAIKHLNSLNKATAMTALLPNHGRVTRELPTAALGRARSIGTLSVPQCWITEETISPATMELQASWVYEPIRLVRGSESPRWPVSQ